MWKIPPHCRVFWKSTVTIVHRCACVCRNESFQIDWISNQIGVHLFIYIYLFILVPQFISHKSIETESIKQTARLFSVFFLSFCNVKSFFPSHYRVSDFSVLFNSVWLKWKLELQSIDAIYRLLVQLFFSLRDSSRIHYYYILHMSAKSSDRRGMCV